MCYITSDMLPSKSIREFREDFFRIFGEQGMEVSVEGIEELSKAGWNIRKFLRDLLPTEELLLEYDSRDIRGWKLSAEDFIELYPKFKKSLVDKIVKASYT